MPVYLIPKELLGLLIFGAIFLLTFFIVFILYIFVRESKQRKLW